MKFTKPGLIFRVTCAENLKSGFVKRALKNRTFHAACSPSIIYKFLIAIGSRSCNHRGKSRYGATLLKSLIVSFQRTNADVSPNFLEFEFIRETNSASYEGFEDIPTSTTITKTWRKFYLCHKFPIAEGRPEVLAMTTRTGVVYPLNTNKMFAPEGLQVNKTVSILPFNSSTMNLHNKKRGCWSDGLSVPKGSSRTLPKIDTPFRYPILSAQAAEYRSDGKQISRAIKAYRIKMHRETGGARYQSVEMKFVGTSFGTTQPKAAEIR